MDMLKLILKYRIKIILGLIALLITNQAPAQQNICGSVFDSLTGAALSRATVFLENTGNGTVTDEKGQFCIDGSSVNPLTIRISYIGYTTKKVAIHAPGPHFILLSPESTELGEAVITASRYERRIGDIPSRMSVANQRQVQLSAAQNSDDLLRMIPNISINRNQGIFSRSAGITMRGLSGTARTLIMIDGVPLNKTAGGSVTWNIVSPEAIERIEVLKGPASSMYGNNAMSGVVNIITKKPSNDFDMTARAFGGTYGTYGAEAGISGRKQTGKKFISYAFDGGFRTGDGYFLTREEDRDTIDARASLEEYHAHALLGLESGSNRVSVDYRYYDGTIGEGRKVFEPDGASDRFRVHIINLDYLSTFGKWQVHARSFLQNENETRVSENINSRGKYKLSDNYDRSTDYGLWMNFTRSLGKHHTLSLGADMKAGILDSELIYRTATDRLTYGGKMLFTALFIRDDLSFGEGRWNIHLGVRVDRARFTGGFLDITDPTSETGFLGDLRDSFSNQTWTQVSPHAGMRYAITGRSSVYVSYGKGFMPPKLDDLSRSGKISKGFKIANPALKPEKINTWELGMNTSTASGFEFLPAIYYSSGKDFQYFVGTGDSIDTGGNDLKPVLQRQNISEVSIIGAEAEFKYYFRKDRFVFLSYAYNHTEIREFQADPEFNKDLSGNELIEVPDHVGTAGVFFSSKIIDFSADLSYTGKQWYDDENTQEIEDHLLVNLKAQKKFFEKVLLSLSVENLFNKRYLDRKGYQAPGRFIIGSIRYSLKP